MGYRSGTWPEAVRRLPRVRWQPHDLVLLWFADNVIPAQNVDIQTMVSTIQTYNLDVLSLSYDPPDKGGNSPPMMKKSPNEDFGRLTNFVEFNFALMKSQSFHCLQEIINVAVNRYGWGVYMVFPAACGRHRVSQIARIAILD